MPLPALPNPGALRRGGVDPGKSFCAHPRPPTPPGPRIWGGAQIPPRASTVRTVRAVTTQSPAMARAWVRPRDPILHARLAPHPPRPQDFDACRRMPLATALAIRFAQFLNPTDPGAGPCTMLGAGIQRLTPAPASGAARPCRGGGPSVAGRGNCSFPRDTGPVHPPGPVSLGNGGFLYSATDPAGPAGCERTDTGQGQLPGLPTSK